MSWWKIGAAAVAVLVFLCVGIAIWFGPGLADLVRPQTTGVISVSGPQVYTRERLVNDRYREDAWLLSELDKAKDETFGATASVARTTSYEASVSGRVGSGGQGESTADGQGQSGGQGSSPANGQGQGGGGAQGGNRDGSGGRGLGAASVDLTPFERFRARETYREQIRTLIIENQLDDRHDLRGNSLYRLRFDAAVIPGNNTLASAVITVSVLPPFGLLSDEVSSSNNNDDLHREEQKLAGLTSLSSLASEERAVWERMYLRWLDSLRKRFEDGRHALQTAYASNQFAPADYDILVNDIKDTARDLQVTILGSLHYYEEKQLSLPQLPQKAAEFIQDIQKDDSKVFSLEKGASDKIAKFRKDYPLSRLDSSELGHEAYKTVIDTLIRTVRQEQELVNLLYRPPVLSAEHVSEVPDGCGALTSYGTDAASNPGQFSPAPDLIYFLDEAFEDKLAKSILGLPPVDHSIRALVPLADVETSFGSDGPAFLFKQRTAPLVASDTEACFPKALKGDVEPVQVGTRTVYVLKSDVAQLRALVPDFESKSDVTLLQALAPDLKMDKELAPLVSDDGQLGSGKSHVGTGFIRAGLLNFIRAAGRRLDAFSYAFTPSEPDEIFATHTLDKQSRELAAQGGATVAGTAATAGARVGQGAMVEQNRNVDRKPVIAFGEQRNSAVATFGWVIEPQSQIGNTDVFRQQASQTSLTALISLPAWWEEIRVQISRSWRTGADKPVGAAEPDRIYTIELPVNFETVDASLFETNDRGPVINDWATEPIVLRPCERADIPIPGRRLWRSTVVMLGGQRADEIFVLPDMNGIVARFSTVEMPSTWADRSKEHLVPLTVWTSQGSTAFPLRARFPPLVGDAEKGCPVAAHPSVARSATTVGDRRVAPSDIAQVAK